MNELEELKARAAKRRRDQTGWGRSRMDNMVSWLKDAEADLDRAIAIAEGAIGYSDQAAKVHADMWFANHTQLKEERDKAIAAAKALRGLLIATDAGYPGTQKLLSDTAWLDDHEPDREVDRRETLGDGHS